MEPELNRRLWWELLVRKTEIEGDATGSDGWHLQGEV